MVKTLEVAIGMVFLYLLLTFVASAVLEAIAILNNWRAKMLYETIQIMLEGNKEISVEEIYANPIVRALGRDARKTSKLNLVERMGWHEQVTKIAPSYIAPAIFSAAVLDTLITQPLSAKDLSPDGFIHALRDRVAADNDKNALLSVFRTTLATQGPSIQAVRLAIEKWFNDAMDRTSGWYKRRTQIWLFGLGLVVAFGGYIDTVGIIRWLWSGDSARQSVLTAAQSFVSRNASLPPPASAPSFATIANQINDADTQIGNLRYPIGWYNGGKLREFSLQFFCGALITAVAISMGSTFWFDALQNFIKIRGTGPKPGAR